MPPPAPDQRRDGDSVPPPGPLSGPMPGPMAPYPPPRGGPDPATPRAPGDATPWAPGDATYGRLPGGPPPPPRPARRRQPARRGGGTPVTLGLVAVNVLVYLLQVADPSLVYRYALLPRAVEAGEYERLLTSAFLHGSLLHLASNMLALYIIGAPLERVLGAGRYLTVYLTAALGGSLLAMLLSPPDTLGVGASGAVFGLFGALVVLRRRVGADARGLGVLIGINLVISFAVPGISWQAHIGGLLTGLLVAALLAGRWRRPG